MLNWRVRYSKILVDNPALFDPQRSVVEVGCGPLGIAQYLQRPVIGVEPGGPLSQSAFLTIRDGSVLELPFTDNEADYVLCIDTMEHLPREVRAQAVRELVRICRGKVIISCPCHSAAASGEIELRGMFERLGMAVPGWLQEHLELGLPMLGELLMPITQTGLPFTVEGNETILQHYAAIALDWLMPAMGEYNEMIARRSRVAAPLTGTPWDQFYSYMFSIEKVPAARKPQPVMAARSNLPWGGRAAIYSVYHKAFAKTHLQAIRPILAGEAAWSAAPGALTDRLADGTSLPNRRWSEMSAIYRIWREGPRTGVVGFTHYRRQFDLRNFTSRAGLPANAPRETHVPPSQLSEFAACFHSEAAIQAAEEGALIVAVPHHTGATIFDHYRNHHSTADYLEVFNQNVGGPLHGGLLEQLESRDMFANNMFIARWELFDELCGFWFTQLRAFEAAHPERDANAYQHRDVAFLSERIFDAWVRYRRGAGTPVITVPIFFLGEG